jgi:hypothetical protein
MHSHGGNKASAEVSSSASRNGKINCRCVDVVFSHAYPQLWTTHNKDSIMMDQLAKECTNVVVKATHKDARHHVQDVRVAVHFGVLAPRRSIDLCVPSCPEFFMSHVRHKLPGRSVRDQPGAPAGLLVARRRAGRGERKRTTPPCSGRS